ncbi:MAG TPA: ABC transporter permease [Vicinamibacterales bacterium]|nr:ABC transporter permease [Vicinamibacterales bacterium]
MTLQDVRYAVRSLVIDRSVSSVVILCLALGIGINATLFALIDGVLIQPLPYVEPDRLFILNQSFERGGIREAGVSYQDLRDIQERTTTFSEIAAMTNRTIALSDMNDPERLQGAAISSNLFSILGQPPLLGRQLRAEDDRLGAEPVVMLSHEVWQRRYQGDPNIIGRSVTVNGKPHTVAGVMPVGFSFPETQKIWIPLGPIVHNEPRTARGLFTFGRLKPGVDISQAREELRSISAQLEKEYPTTNEGWITTARPLTDEFIPDDVRLILWTMMGAVTLVLLIACANVANLMMARSSGRQREFCVRAALGAGRAQLIRQLLVECVILGLASAPLGLAIAYFGVFLLDNAIPAGQVPYYIHWDVSPRVIAYTIAISAAAGLVFGLAPALQAGRLNLQEALRDGARGSGQSGRRARVRNALVVLEVAMALVLLIGASLFVRSFLNLRGASAGFETAPLLTVRFFMTGDSYTSPEQRAQRVDDIMRRVEALPGVESAFASNFIPLDAGGTSVRVVIDGRAMPKGEEPTILFTAVTPHMYQTIGLSILKGRDFTDGEGAGRTAVAVINDTMARRLWPNTDAVGGRFRLTDDDTNEWFTVIGVAPDIRMFDMDDDTADFAVAYVPYRFGSFANVGLTVRAANDNPAGLAAAVRSEIRASDPGLAIFNIRTMEDVRQEGFWQYRLFGYMFGIFGLAALFLAGVGVYGVLSFSVSQRTQELGVRIALGASRSDVLALVVRQGLTLALAGVLIGLLGAFGVTRVIQSLLYNVTPTDPLSFGGVAVFLAAIALVASYVPARRATNVDPIVALRDE